MDHYEFQPRVEAIPSAAVRVRPSSSRSAGRRTCLLMFRAVSLLSATNRRHQTGHLRQVSRRPHGDTGVNERSTAGVLYGIRNRGYSQRA